VSSGHQSQIGKGALFGFVIGAGIGAAITNSNFTGENGFSRSEVILIGAGLGGVPGGLLGALLGAVAKKEVWWKVPM
ncbi:hypothetical protein GWO43_08205, partial [candidate division KSB1 bacterium]|nr:hypothetical protein [candidate division KSB1 bacterium]NIT70869.1 hypothetical protein [candidate division KSB1 bacterium]NIU24607.1 hypothetical protein [candidate division KSB1 bacterium]NIU91544.1 hypothetical protein [candidate division KSB1 bacterium]NIV91212.1 hypothetical protein [candidate division KSB1 bacterium]